jgi:hypothetical protein
MCYGRSIQKEGNNGHIEIIRVEKIKYRQKNEDSGKKDNRKKERKKERKER